VKKSIAILLLFIAVFVCYTPGVRDGFVWDDTALVLRDPLIRSWRLIPEGFNHFLFVDATASDFYRPIQRLVYTIIYCGFAFNPLPYHLASILAHALAAIALFLFADELLRAFNVRRKWIAFMAALIWAIHPVHTAAVVYVAGLADPLAAMFGFFGCYASLRSKQNPLLWLTLATAAFTLSVLSKEIGFVFIPLSILAVAFAHGWRGLWKIAVVAVFVCGIYFSVRSAAEHYPAPLPRVVSSMFVRPITMARAFAEYTGLILLPINLHMDRQVDAFVANHNIDAPAMRELQSVLGVALIALVVWFALRMRKRNRFVFVCLALAGVSYLPVSGVWLLNAAVAEHWLYIPSAFVFLAATAAIVDLAQNRTAQMTMSILAAAWCVFLGARTFVRTFDWKDQRTFLERTIAHGGDSARMLINLGGLELSEGHVDLAKKHLQAALKKEPDQPMAVINLAAAALKENDFKTARELLMRATQMPIVDARASELLAVLESKEHGRADLMRLRLAARTGFPDWSIEKRYIKVLDEVGSTSAAIAETKHCLATQWWRAETWQLLGTLLKKSGDENAAAAAFARAQDYDVHLDAHAAAL
jgi:Flp pilus assembly protein TadD